MLFRRPRKILRLDGAQRQRRLGFFCDLARHRIVERARRGLVDIDHLGVVQVNIGFLQQFLHALTTLGERAAAAGDFETAAGCLRRTLSVDPLREPAQRSLMDTLAKSGDIPAALDRQRKGVSALKLVVTL